MEFLDLPLELLSQILFHLPRVQHLASACRVNKTFYSFGISRLYERASIYSWHKHAKVKVVCLFKTLADYPHLAKYVLKLEIRDFPKVFKALRRGELEELVVSGLRNCVNLRSCTWTRDGALNSAMLRVLQACDNLSELEINGHSDGHYDAGILGAFAHLQRVSVIMPSADVVGQLPLWMARTGPQLRSLTLICKTSPLVTDSVLEVLAPNLVHLEQFSITGCLRVTHRGVWAILSYNVAGLRTLALEGLAPKFDLAALNAHCAGTAVLSRLCSFTLSVHNDTWLTSTAALLTHAPLEIVQLYAADPLAFTPTASADAFWHALVSTHGARLTRVSVHRMAISLHAIEDICVRCLTLRQLFVVVDPTALNALTYCLSRARALAAVHINFPTAAIEDRVEPVPVVLKAPDALAIVRRCPDTITLFGCNARVWQVEREVRRNDEGELVVERLLAKYESPDVPEQFLVVRT
ncbi:F-box domain-containing protein [Mycena sanguinolenta]|uniref:F-box domain-containing protein n=1 Tax=Mycena sanguinolenta TaxID=230812 RepID=A0A8H7DA98_9AGAR|nr:F-box domain-containing protein [Mycena sanguinolenta]